MNKIPKYRVWHRIEKRFVELRTIDFVAENIGYDSDGEFNYWEIEPFDNVVFQQSTGMFDKNEKEIYEGDVVKYQSRNLQLATTIVRWTREEEDNHPRFVIRDLYTQYGSPEIIGNIFENPELLK